MAESPWHRKVREEVHEKFKPNAYASHSNVSKLELFRSMRPKRENWLSDVDIVVLNPDKDKIVQLIEIENEINPEKFMGIVLASHFLTRSAEMKPSIPSLSKILAISMFASKSV